MSVCPSIRPGSATFPSGPRPQAGSWPGDARAPTKERRRGRPLYAAVRQLILGTHGPPAVLAEAFADLDGAEAVVLFGSWAARYLGHVGRAPNDIDVLVIGQVDLDALYDAADAAERQIGLPVQATVRTRDAWLDAQESFIREARSRPLVPVLVDDQANTLAADLEHLQHHQEPTP